MRIIIQGDWFDCQVIRDRVFLWDCDGYLVVLDIRDPIYKNMQESRNDIKYIFSKDVLEKFIVSYLRIKGGIYPLDSVYMGDHLYTATESGLFRRYLQKGDNIAEMNKGLSKKLTDIRFLELTARADMIAMAGASEGLFELYNSNKYRITKSGHKVDEVAKGIYSVIKTYTKSVWYDKYDIISMDKHGLQYRCRFNSNSKADESGKILRNYIKKDFLGDSNIRLLPTMDQDWRTSREVYTIIDNDKGDVSYYFQIKYSQQPIQIASKPRRFLFGSFGMASESKKELVVVDKDFKVKRIEGPITRARVVSGFGKKNGLLVIVCKDQVIISDIENDDYFALCDS